MIVDQPTVRTKITIPNTGLHVQDTNASHDLVIVPGSDLTGEKTLTVTTGDSNRTLTFTGDASIAGTNTGDVTLATDSGLAISLQVLNMGTPSSITNVSTNSVTTNTHTHALAGFVPFAWTEVTGTTQALAINNGYILNNAGLVTATLPVTATVGSTIRIVGKGAGGWKVAQNASQFILIGSSTTTVGATGHIDSTVATDSIELLCTTTNNGWTVISSMGNLTIV